MLQVLIVQPRFKRVSIEDEIFREWHLFYITTSSPSRVKGKKYRRQGLEPPFRCEQVRGH